MADKINGRSCRAFLRIMEGTLSISAAPSYKFVTVWECVDVVLFESHASLLMSSSHCMICFSLSRREVSF